MKHLNALFLLACPLFLVSCGEIKPISSSSSRHTLLSSSDTSTSVTTSTPATTTEGWSPASSATSEGTAAETTSQGSTVEFSSLTSQSESAPQKVTLSAFQQAIDYSAPTYIVTNQKFVLEDQDVVLHYHSFLTIDYSSPVKTCYSYSYEKINEIVTGNESFLSTVSNELYGQGSSAYDGVSWVNRAEKAVTLSGVQLREEYTTFAIEGNAISGSIKEGQQKKFFGGVDYPISDLSYRLEIDSEGRLARLQLSFAAFVDCLDEDASVTSVTTFSYQPQTVVLP